MIPQRTHGQRAGGATLGRLGAPLPLSQRALAKIFGLITREVKNPKVGHRACSDALTEQECEGRHVRPPGARGRNVCRCAELDCAYGELGVRARLEPDTCRRGCCIQVGSPGTFPDRSQLGSDAIIGSTRPPVGER